MGEQKPTWQVFACAGENAPNYWIVSTRAFKGTVLCQTHSEDYARRIVACVNACEGISTETLEGANLRKSAETLARQLREAKDQRDELLAALSGLIEQLDGIGVPDWHGAEGLDLSQSRAAIAKCKQ